jgi:methionine-rich copper-binding protein CopC
MRAVAVVAACLMAHSAWAHASLSRAYPPVGSEITGSPTALTLTYSEAVEPSFCTVQVTGSGGARFDDSGPSAQADGRILVVKLKTMTPGIYDVTWHITSVDTHRTEGHFSFTVKP